MSYVSQKAYNKMFKMVTGKTTKKRLKQLKQAKKLIYKDADTIIIDDDLSDSERRCDC